MSLLGLVLATFLVAGLGGLVPVLNVELWLLGASIACPQAALGPVVLAASLGQVAAKVVLYRGGDAAVPWLRRRAPAASRSLDALGTAGPAGNTVVFVSALVGLPPLYAVSIVAGVVRFPFARFVALTFVGRILRFAAIFVLPRVATSLAFANASLRFG